MYPFVGVFAGDGAVFDHDMAGKPADADADKMLDGFNGIILVFQFCLQGRQCFVAKIIMQAFVHGQSGVSDGFHIFLFFCKMLYGVAFEIFDPFFAGMLLFLRILGEGDQFVYD